MPSTSLRPVPSQLTPAGGGHTIIDQFEQVSAIAKPTLDATIKLRDARIWLTEQRKQPGTLYFVTERTIMEYDGDEIMARLALIPEVAFLQNALALFDDAVRKAAPAPWYFLALSAMLAAMPNATNVTADYQFSIVDMILHDEEAWARDCEPGFSPAVFTCAIRQLRRENRFVPSAAEFLEACQDQRNRFRQLASDTETLKRVRENAEEALDLAWTEEDAQKHVVFPDHGDLPF